ncbi:MAG: HAMP domain-containing protein [Betaproteobacteria bacterium]|nr:HAMP domain-containing protein [Betaproteobacteria bacterium]
MIMRLSFSRRIVVAFALLLLGFSLLVAFLVHRVSIEHEQETLQRLSHGLAHHIVEHWPEVAKPAEAPLDRAALDSLLHMLMTVNPAIDVYVLDDRGRVRAYLGDPDAVRDPQVDMAVVRAFLSGAMPPLPGTDPKAPGAPKIFSAAMFPPAPGTPPGYLYVVLNGQARVEAEGTVGFARLWRSTAIAVGIGLLLTLSVGAMTFRSLTRPLRRLAARMAAFRVDRVPDTEGPAPDVSGDEVRAMERSFAAMAQRIASQVRDQAAQQAAHREVIANVAHDLRTPLTALHGYLEALSDGGAAAGSADRSRYVSAALAQSNKVRRLSQQLFELARLQSTDEILQRDRFRLDELVHDTVQKFELSAQPAPVTLLGPAPGRIEMEGDLHLIDRALTNLIDNAIHHGAGRHPVRVSLLHRSRGVALVVEDDGPGLPQELSQRLDAGQPVREPPMERPGGGFGGLGLAIAQRVAWLHGGSLRTLPTSNGGTRLCLALPLVARAGLTAGE